MFCCFLGSLNTTGLASGIGTEALFGSIRSLAQYKSGQNIIVADYSNDCIRKIDRITGNVTHLVPLVDHSSLIFEKPGCVLYVEEDNVFSILAQRNGESVIIQHKLDTGMSTL